MKMQPTFKSMRHDGTVKRGEANSVRLEDIHERPGFNIVRDYNSPKYQEDVDALVAYLEAGGTVEALEVVPRAEGGVWVVQGHTRRFAFKKMDERGTFPRTPNKDDPSILEAWVSVKPFVGNDAEQLLRQATSTKRAEVDVLGLGRVYNKLLGFGWTPQMIADRSGEKLATIQRVLTLASGNTDVHEMVKAGEVKPTIAAQAVKAHGEKAGEVLGAALVVAKANGKARVTAAVLKPNKHAELRQVVRELLDLIVTDEDAPATGSPSHGHTVQGRWDQDGSECLECKAYDRLRELVK